MSHFPWQAPELIIHSQRLIHSFYHWTGQALIPTQGTPEEQAEELFHAPFVVVSHDTAPDPCLNYGNQTALTLWELEWQEFIQTPSRHTAEPVAQEKREELLAKVKKNGWIDGYSGIRISKTGKRFEIQDVTIWDVLDEHQNFCGQAATFHTWKFL